MKYLHRAGAAWRGLGWEHKAWEHGRWTTKALSLDATVHLRTHSTQEWHGLFWILQPTHKALSVRSYQKTIDERAGERKTNYCSPSSRDIKDGVQSHSGVRGTKTRNWHGEVRLDREEEGEYSGGLWVMCVRVQTHHQ